VSHLLSKVAVTFCSFTSYVQCVHIAAGRRIKPAMPLTNGVIDEMLRQFASLCLAVCNLQ